MSTQYSISFSPEHCIQCYGCEIACKIWRNVELGVRWRRVDSIWHGKFPTIKPYPVSVACHHCDDPACVPICPVGAIEARDTHGVVVVDREKCTGCRACLKACSFHVPQFGTDGTMQKCDLCFNEVDFKLSRPPCVITCPTKALRFLPHVVNTREQTPMQLQKVLPSSRE